MDLDGTGLMKYIQWIVRRKLENMRIIRFDNDCHITQKDYFSSNSSNEMFVQVYIMSLVANLSDRSQCSRIIKQLAKMKIGCINQIYFKRKSIKATFVFQHVDTARYNFNIGLVRNFWRFSF